MIEAKVICDSIADHGVRLTTLELIYPKYIHGEYLTHRQFSRNSSSSRAMPIKKVIQLTRDNPVFFTKVGKNQPGMQADEEVDPISQTQFKREWEELREIVAGYVGRWSENYGIHKQVASRAIEPWVLIRTIVTATEWDNFFTLRDHRDAQPEMRVLAIAMKEVMAHSNPQFLTQDEWHLPYVKADEQKQVLTGGAFGTEWITLGQISAARCARVSYLTHDGNRPDLSQDFELYQKLAGSTPIHASPLEHPAFPLPTADFEKNFRGWRQLRTLAENSLA